MTKKKKNQNVTFSIKIIIYGQRIFQKCYKELNNIDIPIFGIFIYYFKYDVISCKNVENDEKYYYFYYYY